MFKKLYENNHRFQYVASIVSSFDNRDGASSSSSMKNYIRHYKEKLICLGKYDIMHLIIMYISALFFYLRRQIIIPMMPIRLYKMLKKNWIKFQN